MNQFRMAICLDGRDTYYPFDCAALESTHSVRVYVYLSYIHNIHVLRYIHNIHVYAE